MRFMGAIDYVEQPEFRGSILTSLRPLNNNQRRGLWYLRQPDSPRDLPEFPESAPAPRSARDCTAPCAATSAGALPREPAAAKP